MRTQRPRSDLPVSLRDTFVAASCLLALTLGTMGCGHARETVSDSTTQHDARRSGLRPLRAFDMTGLDVREVVDGRALFSLTARHLVRRQRTAGGGLLVYQNLKELVLSDARIEIDTELLERRSEDGEFGAELLFENLAMLDPAHDARASAAQLIAGGADVDLELVTRVSFENLSLVIHAATLEQLRITAPRARFDIGSQHLHLTAPTLVTPGGRTVNVAAALWPAGTLASSELRPEAPRTARTDARIGPPDFGAVLDSGAWPRDAFEAIELELLNNLLSRLPPVWRPLLSALSIASAPGARAAVDGAPGPQRSSTTAAGRRGADAHVAEGSVRLPPVRDIEN